jgi:hypothetical protein
MAATHSKMREGPPPKRRVYEIHLRQWTMPKYEGRSKSSWTNLITPNRNFVEVRWRSLFRSTSLGKRCTSYNVPPTSRKRSVDRLPQASGGEWNRRCARPAATRFIFHVRFSVSKALPPLENRSSSHCIVSTGLNGWGVGLLMHLFQVEHRI